VAMAAADQVIVSGTGHAMPVMRVMGDKYSPPPKFQCRVHAVKNKAAGGLLHQVVNGLRVAKIIALHDMHGKPNLERSAYRIGPYQVPAMDNRFRTCGMGCSNGSGEGFRTVMTIGDDADFQFYLP
jgi:hypothetical protein